MMNKMFDFTPFPNVGTRVYKEVSENKPEVKYFKNKKDLTKSDVLKILDSFKYDRSQFVIALNASLVLRGISKSCHDLDVLITKKLGKELEADGYKKSIAKYTGNDRYEINDQFECFICDLGDYEKVEGYNCSTIDCIKKTYKKMGRPKDLEKLKMLENINESALISEASETKVKEYTLSELKSILAKEEREIKELRREKGDHIEEIDKKELKINKLKEEIASRLEGQGEKADLPDKNN